MVEEYFRMYYVVVGFVVLSIYGVMYWNNLFRGWENYRRIKGLDGFKVGG